ncbi:3-isopropylmalate dehydratase large subunit [Capsicum baccatum]|uniref:3-isopropylmalate dehydratase large subunit n=1 Tax=Capsicum baccatum TaxID=33114 RepID=A0A2G2W237_CAPBA|nr:3-isopropylmalate dehydratase large subunit [Capsicum baccatum]
MNHASFLVKFSIFVGFIKFQNSLDIIVQLTSQVIGEISVAGATYKTMEFVGTAVESLTMEERMTLCNMVIEAGGKNGVIPADKTTYDYLKDKTTVHYEPVYGDEKARFIRNSTVRVWKTVEQVRFSLKKQCPLFNLSLPKIQLKFWILSFFILSCDIQKDKIFFAEYHFDISKLEPLVAKEVTGSSLGNSLWQKCKPHSPDNRALARECKDVEIDRVYIGSCTGGKTEDFMAAAKVFLASGKKVKVPTFLVPATQKVWMDLYTLPVPESGGKTCSQIFEDAGCDTPASPSCGACMGGPRDTHARLNEPQASFTIFSSKKLL